MTKQYRIATDCRPRFSPIWEDEAVIYDPLSTQVLVVAPIAVRLLQTIQSWAPITLERICAQLSRETSVADADLRQDVEALLIEFERLGLVESLAP